MLEIILLIFMAIHIGRLARRKGQEPNPWRWKTVGLWLLFEFTGIFFGIALFGTKNLVGLSLFGTACGFGGYLIIRRILEKLPDEYQENNDPDSNDLL